MCVFCYNRHKVESLNTGAWLSEFFIHRFTGKISWIYFKWLFLCFEKWTFQMCRKPNSKIWPFPWTIALTIFPRVTWFYFYFIADISKILVVRSRKCGCQRHKLNRGWDLTMRRVWHNNAMRRRMRGREIRNRLVTGVGAVQRAEGTSTSCLNLQEQWTKLVINFSIFCASLQPVVFRFQFTWSDVSLQLRLLPTSRCACSKKRDGMDEIAFPITSRLISIASLLHSLIGFSLLFPYQLNLTEEEQSLIKSSVNRYSAQHLWNLMRSINFFFLFLLSFYLF